MANTCLTLFTQKQKKHNQQKQRLLEARAFFHNTTGAQSVNHRQRLKAPPQFRQAKLNPVLASLSKTKNT